MKHSGLSEVSTIFHPKKSRLPASSDEYTVNQPLDSLQKMIDNADNQRSCGHDTDYNNSSNGCRTSETINRYSSGNVANMNADNSSNCERTTYHCPTQNLQLSQTRHNSNRSCLHQGSYTTIFRSCCAAAAKKIYYGICVTIFVTASWVGATHFIKFLYFQKDSSLMNSPLIKSNNSHNSSYLTDHRVKQQPMVHYNAPFFITWFSTNWTILYFPIYFIGQSIRMKCSGPSQLLAESLKGFRDKGLTGGRFLVRCGLFCGLWVATNYMYIHSLRILLATDVMTLFATNVACVYLLSWVILHEQFVGVRIVAVILCDTGIALLAYMDGITGSPTLSGVVLAASAAAGSAVYKVLFKKVIGNTTFGQISIFFSIVGICNAVMLWPVCIVLYFSGIEYINWETFPWTVLLIASVLHLAANMLGNFSIAVTYDLFTTLGLITAVPVSAALDVILYGEHFAGMKLAGMILIACGFFLVMFPNNWPEYITRLLQWSRKHRHGISGSASKDLIDYRTGYIKSHLRSPSGRVR